MDHTLRVLVRLDIDATSAVLEVSGCLTEKSCPSLLPVIRRVNALIQGLNVVVDLSRARHIEGSALNHLDSLNDGPDKIGSVEGVNMAQIQSLSEPGRDCDPAVLQECQSCQSASPVSAEKVAA